MLPTTNILARTFHIRTAEGTGTAFTVDFEGRRYLVTAQHVVGTRLQDVTVDIETKHSWQRFQLENVTRSVPDLDVSVLSLGRSLHDHAFPITLMPKAQMQMGQEMYFSGFPWGLSTPTNFTDFPYRMPLVRRGVVSSFHDYGCYLDGTVNPGMSGGPVYTMEGGVPRVIGVVTDRFEEPAIVRPPVSLTMLTVDSLRDYIAGHGSPDATQLGPDQNVSGDNIAIVGECSDAQLPRVNVNSGIVKATNIEWALALIKSNPTGFRL